MRLLRGALVGGARSLHRLAFPPHCLGCGAALGEGPGSGRFLCGDCEELLTPPPAPLCRRCGRPLGPHVRTRARCLQCRSWPGGPRRVVVSLEYAGLVAELVRRLKYRPEPLLAHPLGDRLAGQVGESGLRADLVVPVPLHRSRERERGFNQAALLARPVARRLGLPLRERALARVRPAPPQASLDARARARNLRGAFRGRALLRGARVLLVDDVLTTGHTLAAAARAAREAGARAVYAAVVAATVTSPRPAP